MTGRRALLLIPVALFGLCAWLGPRPTPPAIPNSGSVLPGADTPIVAVRGEPLAPYEEPLPAGARVRIGSTRYRHPTSLSGWETNAVGRFAVTIPSRGDTFTLTDIETGRRVLIETMDFGPGSSLNSSASADGRRLVIWAMFPNGAAAARLWHVTTDPDHPLIPTATPQIPLALDVRYVERAAFGADGKELVLACNNSILRYDAATGGLLSAVPTRQTIVSLSADGSRYLAADGHNPKIAVKFINGSRRWVFPTYRFRARAPEAEPNAPTQVREVATSGAQTELLTLTVGDVRSGNVVGSLTIPREVGERVSHLHLAADGRRLSFAWRDGVSVIDVDEQKRLLFVRPPTPQPWGKSVTIQWASFADDGQHFVVRDSENRERVFDLQTGLEVKGQFPTCRTTDYFEREIRADLVADHGTIARKNPRMPLPPGYAGVVLNSSPDGRLLAIGDAAGRLDVWRLDGTRVATLRSGGKGVSAVAFSPDGRRLAACDRDRIVRLWTVGSWRERDRIEVPADHDYVCPENLTFTPDGRRLLVCQQDVMAHWDFAAGEWVWDHPGHLGRYRKVPTFSLDGSRILMFRDSWVDARTGEAGVACCTPEASDSERPLPRGRLAPRGSQESTVSADGSLIAGADQLETLCVWESGSDKLVRTFPESTRLRGPDSILRFSPDGRRLVTCDDSGHAHVWEVASGQLAFTLTYPDGAIHDVRFGADGKSLITANHREVIVWDLAPEPGAAADPWAGLAEEAPRAEQARRALLADPVAAVDLFRNRLRAAGPVDTAAVTRLVRGLDAEDYRSREQAAAGLRAIGRRVLPLLRDARADSEEGRMRLAALVAELSAGPTVEELRSVRAVEVLEQVDSPTSRALLEVLAKGDPAAVLTQEAGKALRRRGP